VTSTAPKKKSTLSASKIVELSCALSFSITVVCALAMTTSVASAHGGHDEEVENGHHFIPKTRKAPTTPAARYSGNTPIEETNGIVLNSGTYGLPNAEYEKWASGSTWAVSLAERTYDFSEKERFVTTLDERIRHFEHAVWNFSRVTTVSTPEGKAHAEKTAADLGPRIEKARDAWSKAKSSGRSEWVESQNAAKRAFVELQSLYYGLHKNVR
jgi:hypothetical protein